MPLCWNATQPADTDTDKQHFKIKPVNASPPCTRRYWLLLFSALWFQSTGETPLGETRQTCAAQFPCPRWELPSPAFLPTSPTGCFRWVQTVHPHQHSITHASPHCCSPAPAEPHHGGSTRPGKGGMRTSFSHLSGLSVLFLTRDIPQQCRGVIWGDDNMFLLSHVDSSVS